MTISRRVKLWTILGVVAVFLLGGASVLGWYVGQTPIKPDHDEISSTKNKDTAKSDQESSNEEDSDSDQPEAGPASVTLYFSDSQAEYLLSETRDISTSHQIARTVVEELISGPVEGNHYAAIPEQMLVTDFFIENGQATVDFGQAMNALYPRGRAAEMMFVYSIVNTLTELSNIDSVRFLAGGEVPNINGSSYDFSRSFERYEDIIKE